MPTVQYPLFSGWYRVQFSTNRFITYNERRKSTTYSQQGSRDLCSEMYDLHIVYSMGVFLPQNGEWVRFNLFSLANLIV